MFWKSIDFNKKGSTARIGIIKNGINANIIEEVLCSQNAILVPAPKENQKLFLNEYDKYRDKETDLVAKDVFVLEEKSINLNDYVFIHKDDYDKFLKFQRADKKIINAATIELIKKEREKGFSQRDLAVKFKISLSTINKILNDKY